MSLSLVAAAALALLAPASAQDDAEVVRVNGTTIRQSEVMERLWRRYGPQTLQDMIDEILLRQAAADKKIKADASEVETRIKRLRGQLPEPASLEKQLQASGSSVDALKVEIEDQIAREKLVLSARGIKVAEDEIKKAFEQNRDQLGSPASVHLRHILVKTPAEARELTGKIKAGADFKALAAERSLADSGKATGGDYGFVTPGMLPPDIEKVAFAMQPGELRTLSTPRGQHILQALEKRAGAPAQYAKVKDDLRDFILAQKISKELPALLQELRGKANIQPQGKLR